MNDLPTFKRHAVAKIGGAAVAQTRALKQAMMQELLTGRTRLV